METDGGEKQKGSAKRSDNQGEEETPAKPRTRSERILVVEDDPEVLKLVGDLLEYFGYISLRAENGEAAMAALTEVAEPVALVIIDMVMPGMNGLELYRKLTATHPNLPVIFTTGYDAEVFRETTPKEYPIIQKPYTPSDMLRLVRKLLG